jgi:prefoldin subunit 5
LNVKHRLAGIDANLDDLQAGIEACARTAEALHSDAAKHHKILKQIKNAPFIRSLMKRLGELEVFARDQEGTLQELREHIDRLQDGLRAGSFEVRSPRVAAAADRRRRWR